MLMNQGVSMEDHDADVVPAIFSANACRSPQIAVGRRKRRNWLLQVFRAGLILSGLVAFMLAAQAVMSAGEVPADTQTMAYTVQSGDTLDEIAERVDKPVRPAAWTDWVEDHNAIGRVLMPGEVMIVPEGR